jgi:hypothetical protein
VAVISIRNERMGVKAGYGFGKRYIDEQTICQGSETDLLSYYKGVVSRVL